MIPALGAGGRGFDSRITPLLLDQRLPLPSQTKYLAKQHKSLPTTIKSIAIDCKSSLDSMAQSVERWSNNPLVMGSSTFSTFVLSRPRETQNNCGEAGYRSLCLMHAKHALYHLSYIPITIHKLVASFLLESIIHMFFQ
jgi:hypothetical protein